MSSKGVVSFNNQKMIHILNLEAIIIISVLSYWVIYVKNKVKYDDEKKKREETQAINDRKK